MPCRALERIAPVQVYQGFSQQHDNQQVQREAFFDLARSLWREALAEQLQQAMDAELEQWRCSAFSRPWIWRQAPGASLRRDAFDLDLWRRVFPAVSGRGHR
ncbi:hypothetical protein PSEUDO8O_30231 [Pseudomonas sp. 8O]|nr:hypothetical protein PSEUDO8O_30231 [Pseudomonas sp. 8O]